MPQPTRSDVHVNVPLTQISIAFMQERGNMVADRAFPNIPVVKQADRYYTYDRGMFNRDEMVKRASGTESQGIGYTVDNTPSYFADVFALHHDVPDQVRSNADSVIDPDRDATMLLTYKALIKRERTWSTRYLGASIWANDFAGVAGAPGANQFKQWDQSTSTPIEDIRAAKTRVLGSTGFVPNKLVLDARVWDTLLDHPEVIERIKFGQTAPNPAMSSEQIFAQLVGLDEILVMRGIFNSAAENQANSHSFISGKHALLVYAAPNPGLMVPSGGYTFSWTGLLGAGPAGQRITRFRMEWLKSDRIEIEMAYDQKLISNELGQFFGSAIA